MGIGLILNRKYSEENSLPKRITSKNFQMPPRETMSELERSKLECYEKVENFLDAYAIKVENDEASIYDGDARNIILINPQLSIQTKNQIIFKDPKLNSVLKGLVSKLEELN